MDNTPKPWAGCKNILCIRADNMGDLLMSSPAFRALKETFQCNITLLTSPMASGIAPFIPDVDEIIIFNVPWVKANQSAEPDGFFKIVEEVRSHHFDAAVIFTVYSQNPLPAAMIAYLAQIPRRLAYCRENPYDLLTDWVADKEPYSFIRHQVRRDLDLVLEVGASTANELLQVKLSENKWPDIAEKLMRAGIDHNKPWLIIHPCVSETKREYPEERWVAAAKELLNQGAFQLLLTGTPREKMLTDRLKAKIGPGAFSVAGLLNLEEFILLIHHAPLVISVNTVTIHIAAATSTPVVVLYALTNPQHFPWKAEGKVLLFEVEQGLRSKNEVIRYVHDNLMYSGISMASPDDVVQAVKLILNTSGQHFIIPEMIPLKSASV